MALEEEERLENLLIIDDTPADLPLDWWDINIEPEEDEFRHVISAIKESQNGYDPSGVKGKAGHSYCFADGGIAQLHL